MIISISGNSGVGKTTLIRELLLLDDRFIWQPSYTTRPKRQGEKNALDYYFIDTASWETNASHNDWVLSTTHDGYMYGYRASILQEYTCSPSILILNIDQSGAKELRTYDPTCTNILITAHPDHVVQRLYNRGEPDGSPRYQQSYPWDADWYHCCVVNDSLETCVIHLSQYIHSITA